MQEFRKQRSDEEVLELASLCAGFPGAGFVFRQVYSMCCMSLPLPDLTNFDDDYTFFMKLRAGNWPCLGRSSCF